MNIDVQNLLLGLAMVIAGILILKYFGKKSGVPTKLKFKCIVLIILGILLIVVTLLVGLVKD